MYEEVYRVLADGWGVFRLSVLLLRINDGEGRNMVRNVMHMPADLSV